MGRGGGGFRKAYVLGHVEIRDWGIREGPGRLVADIRRDKGRAEMIPGGIGGLASSMQRSGAPA